MMRWMNMKEWGGNSKIGGFWGSPPNGENPNISMHRNMGLGNDGDCRAIQINYIYEYGML